MHHARKLDVLEHNHQYALQQGEIQLPKPDSAQFRALKNILLPEIVKQLPLPDYRGYPAATPHGLRRFV